MPASKELSQFSRHLFDSYDTYKVKEIVSRRFKHKDLLRMIARLQSSLNGKLSMQQVGESSEGRSINLLSLGTGKKKIFLWSQMHGDEPTATMALLDALLYFSGNLTSEEVKKILTEVTLLILPMVNPDGAERFQRRSIHDIDINRDARTLQTIEARILKQTRDTYSPEFGFNLHDQEPRFTVGSTGKVATIALLAPAYDYAKSDNDVRLRAKKVAAELVGILSPFISGHISRYDDAYEPRAFGDNIQGWGTSTVLIESGGWMDDPEKMYIRKINCIALIAIFHSIASGSYEKSLIAEYENLPENAKNLYDVILHSVILHYADNSSVTADIGINVEEYTDPSGTLKKRERIVDIGDLSTYQTFRSINGAKKTIPGESVYIDAIVKLEELIAAGEPK